MKNNAEYTPEDNNLTGFASNVTGATWTLTATSSGDGLAHQVTIRNDTANDHSGKTATLVGTDPEGHALTVVITLPGVSATVTTTEYFLTLTSITPSATIGADTMDIGWNDAAVTNAYPVNHRQGSFNIGVGVKITGTISYTLQETYDDPWNIETMEWIADATMAAKTASSAVAIIIPCQAIRIKINSLTAGATIHIHYIQGNP